MKRSIFLLSLIILCTTITRADEPVRFTAQAPSTVILDRPFQLVYTVNASGRDLRAPEMNNFEVLAGPFQSSSSSIQIINGRQSASESSSFTYTLQAQKTGTFTIPSASIIVGGQKYTSNGVSIKVLPADAKQPQGGGGQQGGQGAVKSGLAISNDNIFIRTEVSKTNVFEQEAVLVKYKLYSLVDVVQLTNAKLPDFSGFMKQDIEQNKNAQLSIENFNGKNYNTIVLSQTLLYPQHSGVIEIGKANFELVIRIQNRAQVRSIFDDFFDTYTNVSKKLIAPASRITVNALPPNKPSSFTGTVGHFNVSANISATQTKANDAITLKINIAGAGNMKLIKTPTIKFPEGFETYDPKVTNNFKTTSSGVTGSKAIEYMFIPRHSGNYEVPSVEFSYFDTQDRSYKVLTTPVYKLQVAKGEGGESPTVVGNYVDKEDVKQIGKDIRYIETSKFELTKEEEPLFGTLISWLMYLIPLLISLGLFVFFRKQVIENSDISLVKNKKANKVAQKRLKQAQKLLNEGNKDKFYEEVLKAVWTYLSDKLSIPVAALTKDSVETELTSHKVDSSVISQFIQILNTCEFARFAPNSGQQEMGNLYNETIQAISDLEEIYKKF
jgi:hypothetical protein